ncbi:MAG: SDR family NAD(P)-dependent oxidoreductase [Rhodospirillaceae bacterium]|jgi:FlaA1/EpsC-like NDP-sugar epimerase|nr:SDR family NAD(P)-dependent oxidoreductase [Rhodospirillaceae bacterium]MBT6361467.1 SDR family NAD(P)-dependent oxidoreductase [Rhodospirillaceae bacterium]
MTSFPTSEVFKDKRVVITGGGGSIGRALISRLLSEDVGVVRAVDNHEGALFHLSEIYANEPRVEVFQCDIRDEHEINRTFSGMHLAFHAAALKHLDFCEKSPFGTVQTNVVGVQQVLRSALFNRLERVLFTSSDKAVNPTNIMGASKLMGERLFTAANALSEGDHRCIFTSIRFGNVIGSQGSVVPRFCSQIQAGGPVTLTDERMTRFVMTLDDSVQLVTEAMARACGGEIFITKMRILKIADLAETMVEMLAPVFGYQPDEIEIREVGARPAEKLWEELITDEETRHTYDIGRYLTVLPPLQGDYDIMAKQYAENAMPIDQLYHSNNGEPMSKAEIMDLLRQPGILPADINLLPSA